MMPAPELATAAVAALAPYLQLAAGAAATKLGSAAAERLAGLFSKVKARLAPAGQEALADLEKTPEDLDAQAALRQHLKKQLAQDPALHADLAALVEDLHTAGSTGIFQTSSIIGDSNASVQISGSGNQVFTKPA